MKEKIYDAVIIGAGPAGASLAYFLSEFNFKIALVERKKHADTPVRCAEFVPKAFTMLYNEKIKGINNEISHMDTYIDGRLANVIVSKGYILDRNLFVDFLIKEFVKRGGEYLNSSSFTDISYADKDKNPIEISRAGKNSESQNFDKAPLLYVKIRQRDENLCLKTKILAGADGPCSLVGRSMHSFHQNNNSYLAGFQENIIKKYPDKDHIKIFFYPFIPGGYGWLFPKTNSLNIGAAVNARSLKENSLKSIYSRFKDELVKNKFITGDEIIKSSISGLVPVYGIRRRTAINNIVLVGDAAGLCNPITGAGNYNAVLSAKITSEKIKNALQMYSIGALKESEIETNSYFKASIDHALKKRKILEKNNENYGFEELIKKTWVSFKEYWRER